MKLERNDAKLFYDLWFPLLDYTNKKFEVNPSIGDIISGKGYDLNEIKRVANYVWEHIEVLDEYLSENNLPEEHRKIISGWKRCVTGNFILERHLKKGSVFISAKTDEVYMVNGLYSSWEDFFGGKPLPIPLKATLIPFKNKIITDGLISTYNVFFGSGCSSELKEIYMNAKQNKTIHFSL